MNKNEGNITTGSFLNFFDDIVEELLKYKGIDQSDMYKEVLTNIFENHDLEHIAELISEDIFKFRAILLKETDRGSALMAASYLEDLLEKLLRKFFVDDNLLSNNLLNGYGGLSSFKSKIDLAYLLGLISRRVKRDLNLIRKIRNEFAHSAENINFNSSSINNRCNELNYNIFNDDISGRNKFIRVVFGLAGVLSSTKIKKERREEKPNKNLEEISLKKDIENFDEELSEEIEKYIKNKI
ncbi:mannitol repressor [Halanaerobium saccharolyticum]|uniref:Mannitol repressor n=1 Tax=Halanaerobium saccharolyticum TaxID=43595 RepID=A0A4R6LBA8_9FIRM|nr:MltR family transcriptional regulator [Halanaerobium saccharolyticum]TDO69819.1 mannitol repressor [Halanaerobium saccharolyticum]